MASNRRTIVVPEPEFKQWQRHAAMLGGALERTVSVSEMIDAERAGEQLEQMWGQIPMV